MNDPGKDGSIRFDVGLGDCARRKVTRALGGSIRCCSGVFPSKRCPFLPGPWKHVYDAAGRWWQTSTLERVGRRREEVLGFLFVRDGFYNNHAGGQRLRRRHGCFLWRYRCLWRYKCFWRLVSECL